MPFYNREKEIKELRVVLSGEPNLVWFVYGPINSGKTALLMNVFENLPEDYIVFYINFRWRDVSSVEDLLQVLFEVRYEESKKTVKEFIKELIKAGGKALEKFKGIPISEKLFNILFGSPKKVDDVFRYLEILFEEIVKEGLRPVFVLDEMQTIKEIVNTSGKPVLSGLFNFFIGMTKEKHLCHCLCSTSDCLFIEDIYSNARLEGRAKYILVDDLSKDEAFKLYEGFGFEDKELVWGWIGGKVGDMVRLYEEKKQGYSEGEGLRNMLKDEVGRLGMYLRLLRYTGAKVAIKGKEVEVKEEDIRSGLGIFKSRYKIGADEMEEPVLFELVQENILFYNPVEGTVCPQGRLIHRAIEEVIT